MTSLLNDVLHLRELNRTWATRVFWKIEKERNTKNVDFLKIWEKEDWISSGESLERTKKDLVFELEVSVGIPPLPG